MENGRWKIEDGRWGFEFNYLYFDIVHPMEYYLFIPRGKVFSPELDSGLKLGFSRA